MPDICRKLGIAEATSTRWHELYGGLEPSQARELRQLREENAKFKRIVADSGRDKAILQGVASKKMYGLPPNASLFLIGKSSLIFSSKTGHAIKWLKHFGADVADCAVLTRSILVGLDVLKDNFSCFDSGGDLRIVNGLYLEREEEALSTSIVVAVRHFTHAGSQAVLFDDGLIRVEAVLASSVTANENATRIAPSARSHSERATD